MFFKASGEQAGQIKGVLDTYARCTGQFINPGKCSIMFNEKCNQVVEQEVKSILQVE
uniref:Uncharacterized protein n=1 Tax=Arundo donax TaxID=35708 RepID=A0A0A8ZZ57_ARUDO